MLEIVCKIISLRKPCLKWLNLHQYFIIFVFSTRLFYIIWCEYFIHMLTGILPTVFAKLKIFYNWALKIHRIILWILDIQYSSCVCVIPKGRDIFHFLRNTSYLYFLNIILTFNTYHYWCESPFTHALEYVANSVNLCINFFNVFFGSVPLCSWS
jgi:hypothetical protein